MSNCWAIFSISLIALLTGLTTAIFVSKSFRVKTHSIPKITLKPLGLKESRIECLAVGFVTAIDYETANSVNFDEAVGACSLLHIGHWIPDQNDTISPTESNILWSFSTKDNEPRAAIRYGGTTGESAVANYDLVVPPGYDAENCAPLPDFRVKGNAASIVLVGDKIFAFGGKSLGNVSYVLDLTLDVRFWHERAPMLAPGYYMATVLESKQRFIYRFGGRVENDNDHYDRVDRYDIAADSWETVSSYYGDTSTAVLLPDLEVIVSCSMTLNGSTFTLCYTFDVTTETLGSCPSIPTENYEGYPKLGYYYANPWHSALVLFYEKSKDTWVLESKYLATGAWTLMSDSKLDNRRLIGPVNIDHGSLGYLVTQTFKAYLLMYSPAEKHYEDMSNVQGLPLKRKPTMYNAAATVPLALLDCD